MKVADDPFASLDSADAALVQGVTARKLRSVAKAVTLIESTRAADQRRAARVLAALPRPANTLRVGISGAPGAGKSTFIEALGLALVAKGHRVAVLAVDPSSSVSGGSILGDKTRMERLAAHPDAYIRPSPSAGTLGGVAARTRETIQVCEAAGYDVIIVETVGVGQSETAVAGMVDLFILLQTPNAGDDLQAMKRGIVELADIVVINKVDLDEKAAKLARAQLRGAIDLLHRRSREWVPPIVMLSALRGEGVAELCGEIERFRGAMSASGEFAAKRRTQAIAAMWAHIDQDLRREFREEPRVRAELASIAHSVEQGKISAEAAARKLLALSRAQGKGD